MAEHRDPHEPRDWDEGFAALTTLWTEPCFAAYTSQQPMERRTNYTCRDFTEAYTICWDMSTQRTPYNWADELYQGYLRSLSSYVQQHVSRGMEQSVSDDRTLLLELSARWEQYKCLVKDFQRAFVILDRYYLRHNGLIALGPAGWAIFWKDGCSPEVQQQVKEAIVRGAGAGREGGREGEREGGCGKRTKYGAASSSCCSSSSSASSSSCQSCRLRRQEQQLQRKEGGGEEGKEEEGAAPSEAEMRDALTGLAFTALLEISPEVAKEVGVELQKEYGLDSRDVQEWGKPSLQVSLLPRPFPGVLPLGPSQISSVYRYHLLKLRVLSEGGREEGVGEGEGEYSYSDEPCRVQVGGGRDGGREEDAMVTSPPSSPLEKVEEAPLQQTSLPHALGKGGGGRGGGGGGSKRGVEQRIEEEETVAAASSGCLPKEEGGKEGGKEGVLCQRVLKAAVFGMGDDVFRELCDFVHLLDMEKRGRGGGESTYFS